MADQTDISQLATEVAADASGVQISQAVPEVAADASGVQISQAIPEAAADASGVQISQLTIELARGPEVIPPTDNPAPVFIFGRGGLNVSWWVVPQLSDSGVELRDKTIKAFRATGKMTNPQFQIYGYGPEDGIDVDALEAGTGSSTGPIFMDDTTLVTQTPRHQLNVVNSMTHTCRLAGMWPGTGEPDRIDEIAYEVAQQGIRR